MRRRKQGASDLPYPHKISSHPGSMKQLFANSAINVQRVQKEMIRALHMLFFVVRQAYHEWINTEILQEL